MKEQQTRHIHARSCKMTHTHFGLNTMMDMDCGNACLLKYAALCLTIFLQMCTVVNIISVGLWTIIKDVCWDCTKGQVIGPGSYKLLESSQQCTSEDPNIWPHFLTWTRRPVVRSKMKSLPELSELSLYFWTASGHRVKHFSAMCHGNVVMHQVLLRGYSVITWPGDLRSCSGGGISASKKKLQDGH